jgi:hypothetical protein
MPNTKAEYRLLELLEATIYDLKTENNGLRKDLYEATHLNQAVSMLAGLPRADEMDTLVKDGKRLDWIFRNCCVEIDSTRILSFSSRKEVDEAMQAEEE